MQGQQPSPENIIIPLLLVLWTIVWNAFALWRAARSGQKKWFIAILILSHPLLLAIPDIIYLFFFAKDKLTVGEIKRRVHKHIISRKKRS